MSDIKRFIFERVSENIITKPWMKSCYRDYQTREIVMAAWPLNYAITLAWMLNLAWQRYRHRESWIDRMIASEARLKIIQLERERDEARENLEEEMKFHHRTHTELIHTQCKILDMQMGRDEIQKKYDTLATEHMLVVNKLCEERDEARDALSRIDEIFCDGEDTHDDWMKMGNIAKDYFKGLE
jgi:hypothetical protein